MNDTDHMKIVVTGATGFVGRHLVPLLVAGGAELLLVGRNSTKIAALFPGHKACTYDEMAAKAKDFDLLVHLATANNNVKLPEEEFRATNIDLLLHTTKEARRAGIRRFVNVSSFHVLDPRVTSLYARTKRAGVELLATVEGIDVVTVYLPAVHGGGWSGKLSFMNDLPRLLAQTLFVPLAAIRPTVHVSRLSSFLLDRDAHSDGGEILLSDGQGDNLFYQLVRRTIDLSFAMAVLFLFWWFLVLIWMLVRLESPGPGIFAQRRVGRNGVQFTCYKFRTMKLDTVQAATHEVSATAVTRLGWILRKTKFDELPQIWNIVRDEISLIGPRPCLPTQERLLAARRQRGILSLKPGITGLAQINGIDMSDPERLAYWDARYLALQSLALDGRILLATAIGRGQGDRIVPDRYGPSQ